MYARKRRLQLCVLFTSVADQGSGIRCLFEPWIDKSQDPDPGSGMNNPDHISQSLETTFGVKILKFFNADPGSGIEKFGSGMEIVDPGSGLTSRIRITAL
jgi:hypothetical protein